MCVFINLYMSILLYNFILRGKKSTVCVTFYGLEKKYLLKEPLQQLFTQLLQDVLWSLQTSKFSFKG
jgi:hypothetical protein